MSTSLDFLILLYQDKRMNCDTHERALGQVQLRVITKKNVVRASRSLEAQYLNFQTLAHGIVRLFEN